MSEIKPGINLHLVRFARKSNISDKHCISLRDVDIPLIAHYLT